MRWCARRRSAARSGSTAWGASMGDGAESSPITIRNARVSDLAAAARLAALLVREHHAFDPLRFMCIEPIEEGYERFFRSQLDRGDAVLLVATSRRQEGDEVVGYAYGSLEGRNWSDL